MAQEYEEFSLLQPAHNPPECPCTEDCMKIGYQYADISVSAELKPDIRVGKMETECCGEPSVCCKKQPNGDTCEIMIVQQVCVKIPLQYRVLACVGEGKINCHCNDPS